MLLRFSYLPSAVSNVQRSGWQMCALIAWPAGPEVSRTVCADRECSLFLGFRWELGLFTTVFACFERVYKRSPYGMMA